MRIATLALLAAMLPTAAGAAEPDITLAPGFQVAPKLGQWASDAPLSGSAPDAKRCPDDQGWICVKDLIDINAELRIKIPPADHSWHLLTQSYGGTVSLIKDLTQRECEQARIRIWPSSILKSAECFQ